MKFAPSKFYLTFCTNCGIIDQKEINLCLKGGGKVIWKEMSYNRLDAPDFYIQPLPDPELKEKETEVCVDEFNKANTPVFSLHGCVLRT